jgi:hypothetical protein
VYRRVVLVIMGCYCLNILECSNRCAYQLPLVLLIGLQSVVSSDRSNNSQRLCFFGFFVSVNMKVCAQFLHYYIYAFWFFLKIGIEVSLWGYNANKFNGNWRLTTPEILLQCMSIFVASFQVI